MSAQRLYSPFRQKGQGHSLKRLILIIDDDRNFSFSLSECLKSESIDVKTAHTGAAGLDICAGFRVDIVLLDQRLPDVQGDTLCSSILEYNPQTKIIFTTAFPSFENAVKAIRAGAFDYLSKPFEYEELELTIKHAIRTLDLENVEQFQNYRTDIESEENIIIGETVQIRQIRSLIDLASNTDAPVLITGETGSGKNMAAKSIHYRGRFRHFPFISINCAAIPESLIEDELFGHEKGAFTGAASARKGVFEMAEGGTLFLDEIGEMPVNLQSKLLGVLDDGIFRRLGGTTAINANVRIIAATSVDIDKAIRGKRFREDLYYRLGVIKLHLPPLRERRADIPYLCECLLKKLSKNSGLKLANGEAERLKQYNWPGNVRELRNVLERAFILQQGPEIRPSSLIAMPILENEQCSLTNADDGHGSRLDEMEKAHIISELERHNGNYSRTARTLGISLSTLKRRLKLYNLR